MLTCDNKPLDDLLVEDRVKRIDKRSRHISKFVAALPTKAQPGTVEKAAIMAVRYRHKLSLFITGDYDGS